MPNPSYTYDQQWYLDISDGGAGSPHFVRVTDDESFNPDTDDAKYSPKYKCNKTNPEYNMSRKVTIDYDIDFVEGQELQAWFLKHEDDMNVPTRLVRNWIFADGTSHAKMAEFSCTGKPIDGEPESALKAKGTMVMTSEGWEHGTFDPTSMAFAPKADTPPESGTPEADLPQG